MNSSQVSRTIRISFVMPFRLRVVAVCIRVHTITIKRFDFRRFNRRYVVMATARYIAFKTSRRNDGRLGMTSVRSGESRRQTGRSVSTRDRSGYRVAGAGGQCPCPVRRENPSAESAPHYTTARRTRARTLIDYGRFVSFGALPNNPAAAISGRPRALLLFSIIM